MATESTKIKIGTKAKDFDLPATDGKKYSLDSFKESNGIVVAFSCNHCPYAQAAWPLLTKLADEFQGSGISFVGINPNDENLYPEDSFEVMKEKVGEWGINFPYLRDESQDTAKKYGAVCTPDVFVFDGDRKLYYHGRVNDNWPVRHNTVEGGKEPEKVTREELKEALNLLLERKPPPLNQNPSIGCSIKWKA